MKKKFNNEYTLKSSDVCNKFSKSVSYETLVDGTATTGTNIKQTRRLFLSSVDKPLSAVGTLTSLLCNSAKVVEKFLQCHLSTSEETSKTETVIIGRGCEPIISAESKKNQPRYSVNCCAIPEYDLLLASPKDSLHRHPERSEGSIMNNIKDWILCFANAPFRMTIMALALLFTLITTAESLADDAINCLTGQQSCGTSCCWSVENGKLTITGGKDGTVGTMDDYSWGSTGTNTQWTGNITSIYVSGVKNIGKQAFRNLRQVKDITIGDSVESVDSMAFDNDYALQYVDFGDEITSIGYGALTDASQLMQIIIPDTLNNITNDSFGRNPVAINLQIICRGDKVSCSGIYEKLTKYRSQIDGENKTYDATSLMSYADYKTCTSTNYYWDGAKCVRQPDITKRQCCTDVCKDVGGWCNRIRYTPAEAAEVLKDDNTNEITITFKK